MRDVKILISGAVLNITVADSTLHRMRGLAWRENIREDGALLLFPYAARWPIWMLGMRFAIDIIWMKGRRIVCVERNILPQQNLSEALKLHMPDSTADSALELKAGLLPDCLPVGTSVDIADALAG